MERFIIRGIPQLMLFFFIVITIVKPLHLMGQSSVVDSLVTALEKQPLAIDKKLEIYDALVYSLWEEDAEKGIDFGKKGIALAKKHQNKKWLSILYSHTAMSFFYLAQYDSAHFYQDLAFEPASTLSSFKELASAHMNKGSIFKMEDNHPEAIKEYLKSLHLFEKEGNDQGRGMALGNIAHVYLQLRNFKQAEKYLKESEALAIKLNNKEGIGSVAIALTNIYQETDMPKAIEYATRAVDIFHQLGNKYSEAVALSVLGRCYQETGNYQKAAVYTERGLALAKEVGYSNLLAQLYVNLSNVRYYQGNYRESEQLAIEARNLDSANMEIKHNVLLNHIRNNMYLGNLKTAEDYMETYTASIQQFATEEYQESISDLEVKYETEKKQLQIAALEKQRCLYIWLGTAIGGALLIALAFAFARYRLAVNRRKLAEQESRRLEQEKQLVAVQATLDGEAAERTRLAKDLHDGLGGMLSAIKLNLPQVHGDALLEAMDVTRFQTALGMLDDSIQELRRVAHHMMPESLLRHGLKVSLADFCAAIPTANFHYFGNEARLPSKMEIMVYRCIHELVNNALKHANATLINVQLVQDSNRISFTVQDNGSGFDQKSVAEGMGLRNIRQRVEAFQGEMDILSSSQGTEIHVDLEMTKNKNYD